MPNNQGANDVDARRERALRMMALQLVQQLPEDQHEAQRVLMLAREVLDGFLFAQADQRLNNGRGPTLTLCDAG